MERGQVRGRKGDDEQSLLVAFYPEFGRADSPRDARCFVHTRGAATKGTSKKKRGVSEKCCALRATRTRSTRYRVGGSRRNFSSNTFLAFLLRTGMSVEQLLSVHDSYCVIILCRRTAYPEYGNINGVV